MSLLIKALEKAEAKAEVKAEQGKVIDDELALSLQPYASSVNSSADYAGDASSMGGAGRSSGQPSLAGQQAAAGVFSAKNNNNKGQGRNKVLLVSAAILLALVVIGVQFYAYLNGLNTPEIVVARPPVATPIPAGLSTGPVQTQTLSTGATTDGAVSASTSPSVLSSPATVKTTADKIGVVNVNESGVNRHQVNEEPVAGSRRSAIQNFETGRMNKAVASRSDKVATAKSRQYVFGDDIDTAKVPLKITRNLATNGVNPNLVAGYQAFNQGDDAGAQRNYRQVLQGDVRNVDALLGMAAIAARQGRNNDALGWYGKVLELEPRNTVAQAAMVNLLAQADPVSSESRIKSLLAQQPEAAHLHAALGDLYAAQNQWPAAQQAYFQAHHFDPNNAEYAFNLAVSLEQLGKPTLALPYYQRVLDLINGELSNKATVNGASSISGTSAIDRVQLEARIRQLQ